jgi:hypothetical protein
MDYISPEKLRELFTTSLRLDITTAETPTRFSPRNKEQQDQQELELQTIKKERSLSPQSEMILSALSPISQIRLARDLYLDDTYNKNKELLKDLDDPDYIYFNPSENGIYLEYWVCYNIPCPICNSKLYKYGNPNMPAIDVVCINNHKETGVNYFQIKTTISDKYYENYKYFSYKDNYVCVGSKRFGFNCHVIKANTSENRDLLVGYICIEYKIMPSSNIKIELGTSFLLLPNINFKPARPEENDLTFYTYLDDPVFTKKNIIKPTIPSMVTKINFLNKYNDNPKIKQLISKEIKINIKYDTKNTYNGEPAPKKLRLKEKYFIMKMKYLNLKKQFEKTT